MGNKNEQKSRRDCSSFNYCSYVGNSSSSCAPTKIDNVEAICSTYSIWEERIVDHDIIKMEDGVSDGSVFLFVPGKGSLIGTYHSEWHRTINKKAEGIYMGHVNWAFTGTGTTGTFEGTRHIKSTGYPTLSADKQKLVLHGTGDFIGQTLKLSYEPGPLVLYGSLLIPNRAEK